MPLLPIWFLIMIMVAVALVIVVIVVVAVVVVIVRSTMVLFGDHDVGSKVRAVLVVNGTSDS